MLAPTKKLHLVLSFFAYLVFYFRSFPFLFFLFLLFFIVSFLSIYFHCFFF